MYDEPHAANEKEATRASSFKEMHLCTQNLLVLYRYIYIYIYACFYVRCKCSPFLVCFVCPCFILFSLFFFCFISQSTLFVCTTFLISSLFFSKCFHFVSSRLRSSCNHGSICREFVVVRRSIHQIRRKYVKEHAHVLLLPIGRLGRAVY